MDFIFRHIGKFIVGGWILGLALLAGIIYVACHFLSKVW